MFDYLRDPDEIYRRSFERLRAECDLSAVPDDLAPVALRLVHACAMPDILDDLAWDGEVAAAGRGALQAGAPVIADSRMTMDGVIRARLPADNPVLCPLDDARVPGLARERGTTRSASESSWKNVDGWILNSLATMFVGIAAQSWLSSRTLAL